MKSDNIASLTNAERSLLANATEREDGACNLLARTNRRATPKYAVSLLEQGLVREVRGKAGMPTWREDENGRSLALVITKRGRDAVRVAADPGSVPPDAGTGPDPAEPVDTARLPREGSKIATVIMMLSRETGASLPDLVTATGWLPHTLRAAFTGLRKRGHDVSRVRREEIGTVYRIVNGTDPDADGTTGYRVTLAV